MRFSEFFSPTLKESPHDAELTSHQLMIRSGMIRKLAAGVYTMLPLGLKAIRKFEAIVREEMNKKGALECLMPSMIPADLWKDSGRWDKYGKELLRITDRHDNDFCYGPTHEEVITDIARQNMRSYKELPINMYQIQTKFRDEVRPRFGLMRGREFIMKDAYSFHANNDCLDKTYQKMREAYKAIFSRCGLNFKIVTADSGSIGGSNSEEFMITASSGEDLIVDCPECDYAANLEAATSWQEAPNKVSSTSKPALIHTPNRKTIEDVAKFLKKETQTCIKSLVIMVTLSQKNESKTIPLLILLPGNRQLNECKFSVFLNQTFENLDTWSFASDQDLTSLDLYEGYIGPYNMGESFKKQGVVVSDVLLKGQDGLIAGANKPDYHIENLTEGDDYTSNYYADLTNVEKGDTCPRCNKGSLDFVRGIEVGHIFKLGNTYSKAMGAEFLDQQGKTQPFEMGCYGIGVGRTVAAAIEQNHDEKGIVWPIELAPFTVAIVLIGKKDPDLEEVATIAYNKCMALGFDCVFDDRDISPGRKFKDIELMGIPFQVVVGKSYKEEGKFEVKQRQSDEKTYLAMEDLMSMLKKRLTNGT